MADEYVLQTQGLTKEFRGFTAVKNVDLNVRRGTIHALIGPNGAGKTTCFNLITKFLPPTAGRIFYKGRDITRGLAARGGAPGPRALLPDLGRVPALERAGERARGAAALARHVLSFLALGALGRSLERPRDASCWTMWA